MNILNLLKQIGCTNAKSDGICNISELRDKCWVKMFAEQGYTKGELIFPDGGHSSFFLVLPDGNIASADNVMCANGFYAVAEELGIDVDDILGEEPYGEFFIYEDEDGIEHEDCVISIWTPQEFMVKMKQCKQLANNIMTNESKDMSGKNTIRLTESELKNMIIESVTKILKENCNDIENQFSDWALNGSKTSHRGFNAMGKLYEYYYEDDDNALYAVAEEFSDEFGCDMEEVYEVARKFANQYFYYNPVEMEGEGEEMMESCDNLNENDDYVSNDQRCYQLAEDLLQVMEPMSLIAKLGSRMGFFTMRKYLEGIARIEMPDNYGQDEEL